MKKFRFKNSLEEATQAILRNPKSSENFVKRGGVRWRMEDYDEALKDYNTAIELFEKSGEVNNDLKVKLYEGRGMVYFDLKDYKRAIDDHIKLLECGRRGAKLVQLFGVRFGYSKRDSLSCDEEQRQEFDLRITTSLCESGIEFGNLWNSFRGRGVALLNMKRYDEAVDSLKKALEYKPKDEISTYLMGRSYRFMANYKKSIQYFEEFLSLRRSLFGEKDPTAIRRNRISLNDLGRCYGKVGNDVRRFYYSFLGKQINGSNVGKLSRPLEYKQRGTTLKGNYDIPNNERIKKNDSYKYFVAAHIGKYILEKKRFEGEIQFLLTKCYTCQLSSDLTEQFLRKEFSPQIEIDEKLDLIISQNILKENSIELNLRNDSSSQIYQIPRYFVPHLTQDSIEVILDDSKIILIEPKLLLKFLYGNSDFIDIQELSDCFLTLYEVFRNLKMYTHLYILLEHSIRSLSHKDVIRFFAYSISIYESNGNFPVKMIDELLDSDEEEEEDEESVEDHSTSFNSVLTLSLFSELKRRYDDIIKNPKLTKALDSLQYLGKLSVLAPRLILDHKDIKNQQFITNLDTFHSVFLHILKDQLFKSLKYTNVELDCNKGQYLLPVHKEILILRSTFFFRMFKFPGIESTSKIVEIENLPIDCLSFFLSYLYTNEFNFEDSNITLNDLFELLIHSEMFDEMIVKCHVLSEIDKRMKEISEKSDDDFILKLLELGKYINQLPDLIRRILVGRWDNIRNLEESKKGFIKSVVDFGIRTSELAKKNDENEKKNEENEKMILGLKNKILKLENELLEPKKRKRKSKRYEDDDDYVEKEEKEEESERKRRRTD